MDAPSRTAAADSPLAPRRASVLVVEDDPDHLHLIREILEEQGYQAEGVSNGSIAFDRLLRGPLPDLILADLMMPVIDGWEFIVELKARPELAEIPVVVMSGAGARALNSAPVSAGYLEKPLDPARLLETLAACLTRKMNRTSGVRPLGG